MVDYEPSPTYTPTLVLSLEEAKEGDEEVVSGQVHSLEAICGNQEAPIVLFKKLLTETEKDLPKKMQNMICHLERLLSHPKRPPRRLLKVSLPEKV